MKRWVMIVSFILLMTAACSGSGDEPTASTLVLPTIIGENANNNNAPPATVNEVATETAVAPDAENAPPTLIPTPTAIPETPESQTVPELIPQGNIIDGQPAMSHDLLFVADGALQRRDALNSNMNPLLSADGTQGVTAFSITDDGERLVAARLLDEETHAYELVRVDIRNVLTWKLADAPDLLDFTVSPDGRYALYVAGGRPFPAQSAIATVEAEFPDKRPGAGTVYVVDMETQQSQAVGECADISRTQDIFPEFIVNCQGVIWTRDSQNMIWADYEGVWLRHLDASEPTLFLANDQSEGGPNFYYRPLSFARNGRYLLMLRIYFEAAQYVVLDLVTQQVLNLPNSGYGVAPGYVNVNWMQDDRLFNLRQPEDGSAPLLELWRIVDNNTLQLEESTSLTLPPHRTLRNVVHSSNGRFNFVLWGNNRQDSGLYVMASSNEQPVKTTDAPYNDIVAVWAPDGSGAIVSHPHQTAPAFYGAVNEEVLYTLQPYLGNAHTFQWRPQ